MEDKNSFILYSDLIHTVSKMPHDKAGELFMHILKYVNDEEPVTDDLIISLTFEPIKQQLKRDLNKWQDKKSNQSEKGREGNLKRWNKDIYNKYKEGKHTLEEAENIAKDRKVSLTDKTVSPTIANIAVNDNVNVSVNVNDTVNVKDIRKKESPPTYEDFSIYSFSKAKETNINLDETKLKLKYSAWIENGWKDGHDKKIKNWKSKILQTLQYLKTETNGTTKTNYDKFPISLKTKKYDEIEDQL